MIDFAFPKQIMVFLNP